MKTIVITKDTPLNGKQQPNGKTANTALTVVKDAKGTNGTAEKETKKIEDAIIVEKPEAKQLSFDERKERSKRLGELFDRHDKLKKHGDELLSIVRSDESVTTRFYLESSNGDEWQTSNQDFIKKTVSVMHEAIVAKTVEVEAEIKLIEIA